jgi:hypothetical protein
MSGFPTIYTEKIYVGGVQILVGAGDPNGVVSAQRGSVYLRNDGTGDTYHNTDGATAWASGGGGGAGTLQATLALGNTTGGNDILVSNGDTISAPNAAAGEGILGGAVQINAAAAAGDTSDVTATGGTITVNSVPLGSGSISFSDGFTTYSLSSVNGVPRTPGSNNFNRGAPASASTTAQATEIAAALSDPANQFRAAGILSATAVGNVVTVALDPAILPGSLGNSASVSDTITAVTSSGTFSGGWSGTTCAVGFLYITRAPVGGTSTVLGSGNISIGGTALTLASTTRTSGGNNFNRSLSTVSAIATDIAAAINDPANAFFADYLATSYTVANDNTQAVVRIVSRTPGATPTLTSSVEGVMTAGFSTPITADDGAAIINLIGAGTGGSVIARGPLNKGTGGALKGNQRGPMSFDLQVGRGNENQVVTGTASFATGYAGIIEGDYSRIGGAFCQVYSNYSVAEGTSNLISHGSHYSGVFGSNNAIGYGAPYSFIAGEGNRVYGVGSVVFGLGNNNFLAPVPDPRDGGTYVHIVGGNNWGGVYSDLREYRYGNYSDTSGQSNRNYGQFAMLSGFNNTNWSAYGLSQGFGNRLGRPNAGSTTIQPAAWDQYRVQGGTSIPISAGNFAWGNSHIGLAPFSGMLGGANGLATRFGQLVQSLGAPTGTVTTATYTEGSFQRCWDVLRKESNNGATVTLESGNNATGGAVYYNVRQNGAALLKIRVLAFDVTSTTPTDCAAWEFDVVVTRSKYTQATGTFTVNAGFAAGDTVTVGGVVLTATTTARISGARNFDISGGTTSSVCASLRSAMTDKNNFRTGTISNQFIATTSGTNPGPITMTAYPLGTAGNAVTLATSAPAVYAFSGATLTGGLDSAMTLNFRDPVGAAITANVYASGGAGTWTVDVAITNPNRIDIIGTGQAAKKVIFLAAVESLELTRKIT